MKIKAKPITPKLKITKPSSASDESKTVEQIELRSAVDIYFRECGVGKYSLNKRKTLYERPWYLVIGPEGSGKTTIFTHAGVDFPVTYPSKDEGYIPHESTQPSVVWQFGLNAVWLDLPGRLFSESNKTLKEIIAGLQQVRPKCPVDGIVLVIPCASIVEANNDEVQEAATRQRKIIEQLMHTWGIEIPVYLIFSRTDEITGFNELFSDPAGRWDERILGAAIKEPEAQRLPRISFMEQFEPLTENLNEIRLRMLAREPDEERRNAMCRFPIDIAGMREKASLFIVTLFKQGTYQARARFGGFFFISCQSEEPQVPSSMPLLDDHQKLMTHPLNPHPLSKKEGNAESIAPKKIRTFFIRPLLTDIIPERSGCAACTPRRYQRDLFSLGVRCSFAVLLITLFLWLFSHCYSTIKKQVSSAAALLNKIDNRPGLSLSDLAGIDSLYNCYNDSASKLPSWQMYALLFDFGKNTQIIRSRYHKATTNSIINPLIELLAQSLSFKIENSDESFESIKNDLRAYCYLTDQRLKYPTILNEDSLALLAMQALVTEHLFPEAASPTLQKKLETVLKRSLYFLNSGEINDSLSVADPELVTQTQEHLANLMNSQVIYTSIINNVKRECRDLSLDDLISGTPNAAALRCRGKLSEAYTPEFWKRQLIQEFTSAETQRKNIETWVTGNNFHYAPDRDKKQLDDLVRYYFDDVSHQWQNFVSTISVDTFSSPDNVETIFRQLSSKKSPLIAVIKRFADWTGEFSVPDGDIAIPAVQLKMFTKYNSFYSDFMNDYIEQYRKNLEDIAKGLSDAKNARSLALTFNGSEKDPLITMYEYIEGNLDLILEDGSSASLKPLLYSSINNLKQALADPLRQELNAVWKERVWQPFTTSFAKRYPFSNVRDEVTMNATCTFFNPAQGQFWNTVKEYFSYRIVERSGQFQTVEKKGLVPLSISPAFLNALSHAKKISDIFFSSNGLQNRWIITAVAKNHQLINTQFDIDKSPSSFVPGSMVKIDWPQNGISNSGSLHASDNKGNTGLLPFSGTWSIMRLFNDACVYSGRDQFPTNFTVIWKIKAHAKTLELPAEISLSGSPHPFCSNVFNNFTVPENVVQLNK